MARNPKRGSTTNEPTRAPNLPAPRRLARLLIVLAGIALGQAILYGPSLTGRKILLPLDVLADPMYYLPRTPEVAKIELHNVGRMDLIDVNRTCAALRGGRASRRPIPDVDTI